MVNVGPYLSRGNRLTGGTFESIDGVKFEFTPTIGFTAKKAFELEASIKSFRVPLEESVREVLRPSISTNFQVGGRPKWASLEDSTIKKKGNSKINVDSGRLAKVAQQRNIWDIGRHTAIIRGGELLDRVPYALFVQAGHSNRSVAAAGAIRLAGTSRTFQVKVNSGSTPARSYLMIQSEDAEKIKIIFARWIDSRIAKTWGA